MKTPDPVMSVRNYAWRQMLCEECRLPKLTVTIGADRCFCLDCLCKALASFPEKMSVLGQTVGLVIYASEMHKALEKLSVLAGDVYLGGRSPHALAFVDAINVARRLLRKVGVNK